MQTRPTPSTAACRHRALGALSPASGNRALPSPAAQASACSSTTQLLSGCRRKERPEGSPADGSGELYAESSFRKERQLTQEQLAEVLGVTAGAVYKWEAKLSLPELDLIVRMADLYDTSVDVLLGYEMKDNRLDATIHRLRELRRAKDRAGLEEADKALMKYPHSFTVVNECATIYRAFGIEGNDRKLSRRALELTKNALLLIGQNEDPEISEQTLYGKMAEIYLGLGETDKGIELLKAHNAGGMYNGKIGLMLAQIDRLEESAPFLSRILIDSKSGVKPRE